MSNDISRAVEEMSCMYLIFSLFHEYGRGAWKMSK